MSTKKRKTIYEKCFKRPFDIIMSLFALIFLSPIFLITFISSKISIGGKAFFSQYRPGKNGKLFKLYKFRSMTNKTDENGNLLPDDQRITRFGKVIRKLSIDELPQLVNILKGDMSIVGPRPRIVKDIVFYDKYALQSYSVRPGLTGLSQVSGGRNKASFEDIIKLDVDYANRITFWGDIKIILKTVFVLFEGSSGEKEEGARKDYYYCNYLLRTGRITQEQYDAGVKISEDVISSQGTIEYTPELH